MGSNFREIFKHSAVYGLGQILSRLASFLLLPLYTHYLRPADYGVIAILDISVGVCSIVIGSGFVAAANRFHFDTEDERERDAIWWSGITVVFCTAGVLALALWMFRQPLSLALLGQETANGQLYLSLVLAQFPFTFLGLLPDAYLRVRKWSGWSVIIALGQLLLNIALNITFLALGYGIAGVLTGNLIANAIVSLVRFGILASSRGRFRFDFNVVKSLWVFGSPLIVTGLLSLGMHQADRYFLRLYLDMHLVGIYSVGHSIGQAVNSVLLISFSAIWGVVIYEIAARPDAKKLYVKIFEYYCYGVMLLMLALSLFSRPLIQLMTSSEFHSAAEVIPIISLAYFFFSLHTHFSVPILLSKRTKYLLPSSIAGVTVCLLGNYWLIPRFGIWAAAWTCVATFLTYSFSGLVIYRRFDAFPYPFVKTGSVLLLMMATFVVFNWFFGVTETSVLSILMAGLLWISWAILLFGSTAIQLLRQRKSFDAGPPLEVRQSV